jgi:L,D-transpeptidase catalytic domain
MRARRNTKRKRKNFKVSLSSIRTFIFALIFGVLSSLGLWRCIDGDDAILPKIDSRPALVKKVDVGKGKQADPTLVDEQRLLQVAPPQEENTDVEEEVEAVDTPEETGPDLEELFPLHAVAFHFHTQLLGEPKPDAKVAGYARRGSTFRVGERIHRKGCPRGWYEVSPGGMFVCFGKGVNVSKDPITFAPSPPPVDIETSLPYSYSYVLKDNTPEYWRIPTADEIEDVDRLFAKIEDRDKREAAVKVVERTPTAASVSSKVVDAGVRDGGVTTETTPTETPTLEAEVVAEVEEPIVRAADGGLIDPYALPPYVHLRMARGYYVSTDDRVQEQSGDYHRTVRGRYIPADKLAQAKPSTFSGFLIDVDNPLPQVFVVGGGVKLLKREKEDGPFKNAEKVTRLSRLPYYGETQRRNRRYIQVADDRFLSSRVAAVVRQVERPEEVGEDERWIDVDISEQTLVAYEGNKPVFATLISSGRKDFDTPEGSFIIYSKHVTITMDDTQAGDEAYSIEDVPWTQYFEEGYALHAAFWHNRFGRVRSHGCINLPPADARRLFLWTGPHVPTGVHGAASTRENKGTRIIIHK